MSLNNYKWIEGEPDETGWYFWSLGDPRESHEPWLWTTYYVTVSAARIFPDEGLERCVAVHKEGRESPIRVMPVYGWWALIEASYQPKLGFGTGCPVGLGDILSDEICEMIPRQYSVVRDVTDVNKNDHRYVFLGEVPNRPGLCVVMHVGGSYRTHALTKNFVEADPGDMNDGRIPASR